MEQSSDIQVRHANKGRTSTACVCAHVCVCVCVAIIGREITMSALREWAAALGGEARKAVAVSNLGKWKTATQVRHSPHVRTHVHWPLLLAACVCMGASSNRKRAVYAHIEPPMRTRILIVHRGIHAFAGGLVPDVSSACVCVCVLLQMTSLTVLLALRDGPLPGTLGDVAALAGPGLLIVATYLTLLSLWEYTRALWRFMV